jgi:hypothetical protein
MNDDLFDFSFMKEAGVV